MYPMLAQSLALWGSPELPSHEVWIPEYRVSNKPWSLPDVVCPTSKLQLFNRNINLFLLSIFHSLHTFIHLNLLINCRKRQDSFQGQRNNTEVDICLACYQFQFNPWNSIQAPEFYVVWPNTPSKKICKTWPFPQTIVSIFSKGSLKVSCLKNALYLFNGKIGKKRKARDYMNSNKLMFSVQTVREGLPHQEEVDPFWMCLCCHLLISSQHTGGLQQVPWSILELQLAK